MPEFLRLVATLREQMHAELTRSDVLRVLVWPILILLLGLLSALAAGAPKWVLLGLGGFAAAFLLIYLVSFVALLIYDRDALRTEKYNLQKMAIEHGLLGDSDTGLMRREIAETAGATKMIEGTGGSLRPVESDHE